jgi:hypothetical protein
MEEIKLNDNELNETQLEYKLFLNIDQQSLIEFYQNLIEYVQQLSQNYIWNNERFHLSQPIKRDHNLFECNGVIDFGDNYEDEWYVVYILNKLTSKYQTRLVAQVNDSDGEFILIHCANYLPKWASSAADNCMQNRVFLANGKLHMIPPATTPAQVTYLPAQGSIDQAYFGAKIVFDFGKVTQAPPSVQDCFLKRISSFEITSQTPSSSSSSSTALHTMSYFHRSTCLIPAKLAYLLKSNPSLISIAINRFCEKDPKDLKLCNTLTIFKSNELVNYQVLFTKHLYGKLKYTDFKPEKRHEWPAVESYIAKSEDNPAILRDRLSLGFKLTCAFEIFAKTIINDKNKNKSFDDYINRLKNLGYFKDFIEHSKSYNELYEKAKQNYFSNEDFSNDKFDASNQPSGTKDFAVLFDSFYLNKLIDDKNVENIKEELNRPIEKDDNDDWLCVEAPQLDDYLEMYSRGDISSTYDFRILSNAFKKFLQKPNAKKDLLEGAEYKNIDKNTDENLIDFNIDAIKNSLNEVLKETKSNKEFEIKEDEEDEDEGDSFYEIDEEYKEESTTASLIDENIQNYMNLMDEELKEQKELAHKDTQDELEIDMNLVSNALESYSSQLGLTGPVSNILKSLGL